MRESKKFVFNGLLKKASAIIFAVVFSLQIFTSVLPGTGFGFNAGAADTSDEVITEQKINEISESIIAQYGDDAYGKILGTHDYLIENGQYDVSLKNNTAYSLVVNGQGMCDSYTDAFSLFMDEFGIPCVKVTSGEMNHSWNMVQFDNKWYHIDVTWDDPILDEGEKISYNYFLRNDNEIKRDHYGWTASNKSDATAFLNAPHNDNIIQRYLNGRWYYRTADKIMSSDIYGGDIKEIAECGEGKIAQYNDYFVYSSGADIRCYDTITGDDFTIYTVSDMLSGFGLYSLEINKNGLLSYTYRSKTSDVSNGTLDLTKLDFSALNQSSKDKKIADEMIKKIDELYASLLPENFQNVIPQLYDDYNNKLTEHQRELVGSKSAEKLRILNARSKTDVKMEAYELRKGNLMWSLDTDGTLMIYGVDGVAYYSANWFDNKEKIKTVVIDNRITSIGDNWFSGCSKLSNIEIPDGVESIGNSAFSDCTGLEDIVLPDSITNVGEKAFSGCKSLTSVHISNSITVINSNTFMDCQSLSKIIFGNEITKISVGAFFGCEALENIYLPGKLSTVDVLAFRDCKSLKTIFIPKDLQSIGISAFIYCDSITDVYYPGTEQEWNNIEIGDNNKDTLLDANIHYNHQCSFGKYTTDAEVTCLTDGKRQRDCSVCGRTETEIIPALKHNFGDEWVFGSSVSCTSDGYKFHVCANCGEVADKTPVISAGHKYNTVETKPSCTKCGYTSMSCPVCGESRIYKVIDALGHNFVEGVCTRCDAVEETEITRLYGAVRTDTAIAIAGEGWEKADTVILANGKNFADALAGGPLSYALDAPILLTGNKAQLEESVAKKIENLEAKKVVILGGEVSVNKDIENVLSQEYEVERIAGATRYETSVAIADKLAELNNGEYSKEFFITYAKNYPDALSIGSVAAIKGMPILFVGDKGKFADCTVEFIKKSGAERAIILGGYVAVGEETEENLAEMGITDTDRVYGETRYDTALEILKKYSDVYSGKDIIIASGAAFPDALAGGALAAKKSIPVLIVHPNKVIGGAADYIGEKAPGTVYVLGGQAALSDERVSSYLAKLES